MSPSPHVTEYDATLICKHCKRLTPVRVRTATAFDIAFRCYLCKTQWVIGNPPETPIELPDREIDVPNRWRL